MLELISQFLESYGALLAIILSWAAFIWVSLRNRQAWKSKKFLNHVNFSLNDYGTVEGKGTLLLRTLMETTIDDIFNSDTAANTVLKKAEETTIANPFINLETDDDQAFILRAVLNKLSERFADIYVARSLGKEVVSAKYVFGVTCEKYGETPTKKIRVMLVNEKLLREFFHPMVVEDSGMHLSVVAPSHSARLKTLREMGRLYFSKKKEERRLLSIIELGCVK